MAADDLYDRDFYAWTKAQAEALRARGRGANAIDYDVLAEEVEDLGKSDQRECFSGVETIIEHLFKLAWSQRPEPRAGWEETILRERNRLELVMTASLRRDVEATLAQRHERALRVAAKAFSREEPDVAVDPERRWSLPQILGDESDPIG
ncbi:MAG TPA: DUF29 domain-containing protein [Caulobacterales bacterium]|nr:DUF29 domain-containing protein [Caulobacterales bacterium]